MLMFAVGLQDARGTGPWGAFVGGLVPLGYQALADK